MSEDERYLISRTCGVPTEFYLKDGLGGKFYSLTRLRSLVTAWKKDNNGMFDPGEYKEILRAVTVGLESLEAQDPGVSQEQDKAHDLPDLDPGKAEDITVNFSSDHAPLPSMVCYIPVGNELKREHITIDTAASLSILTPRKMKELGLGEDQLDRSKKFRVNTAGGAVESRGVLETFVFLRARDKYYRLPVRFLCLASETLDKLLLGLPDLRRAQYKLEYAHGTERCRLRVLSSGNKWVSRQFITYAEDPVGDRMQPAVNYVCEGGQWPGESDGKVMFVTEDEVFGDYRLECFQGNNETIMKNILAKEANLKTKVKFCEEERLRQLNWPETITTVLAVDLPVPPEVSEEGDLRLEGHRVASEAETLQHDALVNETMEMLTNEAEDEFRPEDALQNLDDDMLRRLGAWDLEDEAGPVEVPYWCPDLGSLPDDFIRGKFRDLFYSYQDVFSKDKYSVKRSKLGPISIHLKKDWEKEYRPDTARNYSPEVKEVIWSYLEKMLAAGFISEVTHKASEASVFNHSVFVVFKKDGLAEDNDVNSRVVDLSKEEYLAKLRKSSRLVSDLRNLNAVSEEAPALLLPSFHSEVNMFANTVSSTADICSCFFGIPYSEETKPLTQFCFDDRIFIYEVCVMGAKNSPGCVSYLLATVFNKHSFDRFMARSNCNESRLAQFARCFLRYIDDLALCASKNGDWGGFRLLHLVWEWVLTVCREYGLTLSAKKVSLGKREISLLGFVIRPQDSEYCMARPRLQALKDLQYPKNQQQNRSLLSTVAYFDRCLVYSRALTALHVLLSHDQKEYNYTVTHYKEFMVLKFSFELNLAVAIPDPQERLFLATDASFTSYCGSLYQIQGPLQSSNGAQLTEGTSQFRLAGLFSRSFKRAELTSSILVKELYTIVKSVEYFYQDLVTNTVGTTLVTDIRALSLLPKLKYGNSRMQRINSYLAAIPRLSVVHVAGGSANFLADTMSRLMAGYQAKDGRTPPQLIPAKYLDWAGDSLPELSYMSPERVKFLINLPLPGIFANVPLRSQRIETSSEKLQEIVERGTVVEEEVLRAALFGYEGVPKDSVIFRNDKTRKVISKTDFEKLERNHGLQDLKKYLHFIRVHSFCVDNTRDYLEAAKEFLLSLKTFMEKHHLDKTEGGLYREVACRLADPDMTIQDFVGVHRELCEAQFLGEDDSQGFTATVKFVSVCQQLDSEVTLLAEENRLKLRLPSDVILGGGRTLMVKVGVKIGCQMLAEVTSYQQDSLASFVVQKYLGGLQWVSTAIIVNDSTKDVEIKSDHDLITVNFHYGDPCECTSETRITFILSRVQAGEEDQTVSTEVMLGELMSRRSVEELDADRMRQLEDCEEPWPGPEGQQECFEVETEPDGGNEENTLPVPAACPTLDRILHDKDTELARGTGEAVSASTLTNRLIFMGALFGAPNVAAKTSFISQLQQTDPYWREMRTKILEGNTREFIIRDDVIYRHVNHPNFQIQLCLPGGSYSAVCDSLHSSGRHLSDSAARVFLNQYVFSPDASKLISQSREGCSVCVFTTGCRRTAYIQDPAREQLNPIGMVWSVDFQEDLPRSERGNRFCFVAIEQATSFGFFKATRTTNGSDIVCCLEELFKLGGIPYFIRSDFGPGFRSKIVMDFLQQHFVTNRKQCPRRSEENGGAERGIRSHRQILSGLVAHHGDCWTKWDELLVKSTALYNQLTLYAADQPYSRAFLYKGPLVYIHPMFRHSAPDTLEDPVAQEVERGASFKRIYMARKNFQKKYKTWTGTFQINDLVIVPLSKRERQLRVGNSISRTVDAIYRIKQLNTNSARLEDLLTGTLVTKQLGEIKHLPLSVLQYVSSKFSLQKGGFASNIFKLGNQALLEKIEEAEQSLGSQREEVQEEEDENSDNEVDREEEQRIEELVNDDNVTRNLDEANLQRSREDLETFRARSDGVRRSGRTRSTPARLRDYVMFSEQEDQDSPGRQTKQRRGVVFADRNCVVTFKRRQPVKDKEGRANLYGFRFARMKIRGRENQLHYSRHLPTLAYSFKELCYLERLRGPSSDQLSDGEQH